MALVLHALLGLGAWFAVVIAPLPKMAFEDRAKPKPRQRGVAPLPTWPLVPIALFLPVAILGPSHAVSKAIAGLNLLLLAFAIAYFAWWTIRLRRAG